MKITKIAQQERLQSRYSIYVDESYAFSLSADALLAERLHVGQELDEPELASYKKLSQDDKAYNLALQYVVRRMRSQGELRDYFRRKGYDDELAAYIFKKLAAIGLLDDLVFAEAWVRNRRLLKSVSKRRLSQELRQKHIANDIIEKILAEDEVADTEVLAELVASKRRQLRYRDDLKLMQYLARQGFSYDDIKTALQDSAES